VVNCNLQRLDGPVRGNGKIIQELESLFRGAGWNVIKVVWGRAWDHLLAADRDGALVNLMNNTHDGDFQTYKAENGAFIREHFFGRDRRTAKLVEGYTDDEIWSLQRGGHDYRKMYAAYEAAQKVKGQPTVILAKTIKGWTLGSHFEARNSTHQMKKLTLEDLKEFRDRLHIPIADSQLDEYLPPYVGEYPVLPEKFDEEIEIYKRHWSQGRGIDEPFTPLPADENYSHLTMVKWGSGHDLQWRWRAHQEAMTRAKTAIKEVDELYGKRFGRSYGGLLDEYRCDGAEAVIVAMGTIASTARAAVDRLRGEGKRVGLVKLKALRPFPAEEFTQIGEKVEAIGVLDRNISLGEGGVTYNSVRSALYELEERPVVHGYHVGLAGNEVRVQDIARIAERALRAARGETVEPPVTWVGR